MTQEPDSDRKLAAKRNASAVIINARSEAALEEKRVAKEIEEKAKELVGLISSKKERELSFFFATEELLDSDEPFIRELAAKNIINSKPRDEANKLLEEMFEGDELEIVEKWKKTNCDISTSWLEMFLLPPISPRLEGVIDRAQRLARRTAVVTHSDKFIATAVATLIIGKMFVHNGICYQLDLNGSMWIDMGKPESLIYEQFDKLDDCLTSDLAELWKKSKSMPSDEDLKKLIKSYYSLQKDVQSVKAKTRITKELISILNVKSKIIFDRDDAFCFNDDVMYEYKMGQFSTFPATPGDFVTKRLGCSSKYTPQDIDEFMIFFVKVLPVESVRDFILRSLLGSLLARNPRQFIFFMGHGRNGKSAIENIIAVLFNGYFDIIPAENIWTKRKAESASASLAGIEGKRIIFAREPEPGKVATGLLKQLVAGDKPKINVRGMYAPKNKDIAVDQTIIIEANWGRLPTFDETDKAIVDRVVAINFPSSFELTLDGEEGVNRQYRVDKRYGEKEFLEILARGLMGAIIGSTQSYIEKGIKVPKDKGEFTISETTRTFWDIMATKVQ